MNMHERPQRKRWFQSQLTPLILLGFIAVGAFFLITAHTAHLLGAWPFFIFLFCPLMMFFMMRGMHGGTDDHNHEQPPEGGRQ